MTIEAGGDINAGDGDYNLSTQARYKEFKRSRMMNEPVAVVSGYYGGQCVILPINPARLFNAGTALYTNPSEQQKPWVDLTDEEIMAAPENLIACIAYVRNKLKEKNNA